MIPAGGSRLNFWPASRLAAEFMDTNPKHRTSQSEADTDTIDTLIKNLQAPVSLATAGVELDPTDYNKLVIYTTNPATLDSLYDLLRERLNETDQEVFDLFTQLLEDYWIERLAEAERQVRSLQSAKGGLVTRERRRARADKLPLSDQAKSHKPVTFGDIMGGMRERAKSKVFAN